MKLEAVEVRVVHSIMKYHAPPGMVDTNKFDGKVLGFVGERRHNQVPTVVVLLIEVSVVIKCKCTKAG